MTQEQALDQIIQSGNCAVCGQPNIKFPTNCPDPRPLIVVDQKLLESTIKDLLRGKDAVIRILEHTMELEAAKMEEVLENNVKTNPEEQSHVSEVRHDD